MSQRVSLGILSEAKCPEDGSKTVLQLDGKGAPPISTNPNPQKTSLFIPWLAVSITFTFSLIVAIATMLHGMAQISLGKTELPWWYRTLMLLSESGLALSTLGILVLVVISIRRAAKAQP